MFNGFDLSTATDIKLGSQQVSSVYYGSQLIWPTGPHDYSHDYLTFEVVSGSGDLYFFSENDSVTQRTIYFSIDDGNTWTSVTSSSTSSTTPYGESASGAHISSLNVGDKILIKGNNNTYSDYAPYSYYANKFITVRNNTLLVNVYGNIMSLIYGDNFIGQTTLTGIYNLYRLFQDTWINDASNLILPATTLTERCYVQMFYRCLLLTTAPELPATTLADHCYYAMFLECSSLTTAPELHANITPYDVYCYSNMFSGCTSLTTAPSVLPSTTLADCCYSSMFRNCTSLTTAPSVLPATTLYYGCYEDMFWACTSLTTAPELPATTLTEMCYSGMFYGCTSLNYIKCLATNISASNCTDAWVVLVAQNGTFVKDANMSSWTTGNDGIPTTWTVINV